MHRSSPQKKWTEKDKDTGLQLADDELMYYVERFTYLNEAIRTCKGPVDQQFLDIRAEWDSILIRVNPRADEVLPENHWRLQLKEKHKTLETPEQSVTNPELITKKPKTQDIQEQSDENPELFHVIDLREYLAEFLTPDRFIKLESSIMESGLTFKLAVSATEISAFDVSQITALATLVNRSNIKKIDGFYAPIPALSETPEAALQQHRLETERRVKMAAKLPSLKNIGLHSSSTKRDEEKERQILAAAAKSSTPTFGPK